MKPQSREGPERLGPDRTWREALRLSMRLLLVSLSIAALDGCQTWSAQPAGLIARPQPRGPDANFEFVKKLLSVFPVEAAARFRTAIARAKAIKPDSLEVKELEARFADLLGVPYGRLPKTFTNSIGMKFVLIPPGEFDMGSDDGEPDERPVHRVRITRPFYLGVYEVTEWQFGRMKGIEGSGLPQKGTSWYDARAFCERLSTKEGLPYGLPTEAEWEYACRAGTRTKYSFGDTWDAEASRRPNPWGICDMQGSLREWCQDWSGGDYYRRSPTQDPQGPADASCRVLRGGSWCYSPSYCRAASRDGHTPDARSYISGFRIVLRGF